MADKRNGSAYKTVRNRWATAVRSAWRIARAIRTAAVNRESVNA